MISWICTISAGVLYNGEMFFKNAYGPSYGSLTNSNTTKLITAMTAKVKHEIISIFLKLLNYDI